MANNFWGCNFNFGSSSCGVQVRQGIAHMVDKTSFVTNEGYCAGICHSIDNPEGGGDIGGLLSPTPCAWDEMYPQTGSGCVVGAVGGTAYHLAPSTGADGILWLQGPGSPDLNAAAQHFVNGLSPLTGCSNLSFSSTTSILNIPSSCVSTLQAHVPTFFIRNDDRVLIDFGSSLADEICYLFTGSYTQPCTYLNTQDGPGPAFASMGQTTSSTSVNLSWWMYTGGSSLGYGDVGGANEEGHTSAGSPFDSSLYYTFNSRFVSGVSSIISPNGPCDSAAVPTRQRVTMSTSVSQPMTT